MEGQLPRCPRKTGWKAMKRLGYDLIILVSLGIIAILSIRFHFNSRHEETTAFAESCSTVSEIVEQFGDPLYSSAEDDRSRRWFERQFSITFAPEEGAYAFHPPNVWPNFIIVAITDQNGQVTSVYPIRS